MRIVVWGLLVIICFIVYQSVQENSFESSEIIHNEVPVIDEESSNYESFSYLNRLREAAGLVYLSNDDILSSSAKNHAKYLIQNDIMVHEESPSNLGFTGVHPKDRAKKVGYKSAFVVENISNGTKSAKESIDSLFSAIYHRFGFLDFKIDSVGIGIEQNTKDRLKTSFVYNMGSSRINYLCSQKSFDSVGEYIYGVCLDKDFKIEQHDFKDDSYSNKTQNKRVIIYPYDGQEDVPPAFFTEVPDPLPSYKVSGFPISISFDENYAKQIDVTSFKLFDSEYNLIENTIEYDYNTDPNGKFRKFDFALFPLTRLKWNAQYSVEVVYNLDGIAHQKNWSFHTRTFDEAFFNVNSENYEFTVKKNSSTVFYFEPTSKTDVSYALNYPSSVYLEIIDANTIMLFTYDDDFDEIKIMFGTHKLIVSSED